MCLMARAFRSLWPVIALIACQPISGGSSGQSPPALPEPPRAISVHVTENRYGTVVDDPFRWLEQPGKARADWVSGQAEAGRRWLDRLPQRDRVSGALERFQSIAGIQVLQQFGGHVYFFHDRGGTNQSDLYRVRADAFARWTCASDTYCDAFPAGAQQVLPAADWPGDRLLVAVAISPDGQRVAWQEETGGSGGRQWFWKAAGSYVGEGVESTGDELVDLLWAHDSRGWYTVRTGETGDRLEYRAVSGDSGSGDVCPLEAGTRIDRLHRIEAQPGELLMQITSPGGEPRLLLCDVEGESLLRLDAGALVDPRYLGSRAGWHYFFHRRLDWRGEVIALARSSAGQGAKRSIVSPADRRLVDAVLTSAPQDPVLWLHYRENGRSVPAYHSGRPGSVARNILWQGMPGAMRIEGMMPAHGTGRGADRDAGYLVVSGPVSPPHIVRLQGEGMKAETLWSAQSPSAMKSFVIRRHDIDTGGGRSVPLYVAGSAAVLDSARPAPLVLEAYGGFDEPVDLHFSPSRAAWMALGGIYAVAGVRGGGDHDQEWYLAGRGAGKLDSIHDLEAVMAWLMDQGITAPERLALRGYSQGATLAAAVAARGRQPVQALLASAGVMDMLRYPLHGAGRTWLGEYGDPRTSAGFDVLWEYSPYHQALEMEGTGRPHPLTLVMTRDEDPVVPPLHSYKYLAALQQAGVPVILRLEQGAAHAGTAPVNVLRQRHTDQWALLLAVLSP